MFNPDLIDENHLQSSIKGSQNVLLRVIESNITLLSNPNLISIGSGSAYFESCLGKMLNKNVTCIDPDPKLYDAPQVWIEPTFKTVDDIPQNLLKTFNYAMIIWPYPENKVRYNSYDYKALEKLLPDAFVIVYAPCGASGSSKLIGTLCGSNDEVSENIHHVYDNSKIYINNKEYICTGSHKKIVGSGRGFTGSTRVIAAYIATELLPKDFTGLHTIAHENSRNQSSFNSDLDALFYSNEKKCIVM